MPRWQVTANTSRATAVVGGNGAFSAHLTLPRAVGAGTYTLTAKDAHGNSATTRLTILPLIVVRTGAPTASAGVIAHMPFYIDALGFAPNEAVKIQITFPTYSGNDVVVTRTPNADAHGNVYNVVVTPPNGAKVGYATVTAAGQTSNKQGSWSRLCRISGLHCTGQILGDRGDVGRHRGSGLRFILLRYGSRSRSIAVAGSKPSSVTASTDGNGNFRKYIAIPSYTSPGTYTVVATDVDHGPEA